MSEIETRCEIRENGIPMFSIDIVSYLDASSPGDVRWAYFIQGNPSPDQLVGVLEKIKINIILDQIGQNNSSEEEEDDTD